MNRECWKAGVFSVSFGNSFVGRAQGFVALEHAFRHNIDLGCALWCIETGICCFWAT